MHGRTRRHAIGFDLANLVSPLAQVFAPRLFAQQRSRDTRSAAVALAASYIESVSLASQSAVSHIRPVGSVPRRQFAFGYIPTGSTESTSSGSLKRFLTPTTNGPHEHGATIREQGCARAARQ